MGKSFDRSPLIALEIDRESQAPMHRQVFDQIRTAILNGRLPPGWRLPSSRALSQEIGVSRNTILSAYDQLFAEGYTEGRIGSGTRVSKILPEEVLAARTQRQDLRSSAPERTISLSRAGNALLHDKPRVRRDTGNRAFRPGVPDTDRFPWNYWSRLVSRFWRNPPRELISYGEVTGYGPLRNAIADYLRAVRGLVCSSEQVIVTTGAQQAIDLTARALIDPGDKVWIEEPGYAGIRGVLIAAGATLVPLRVDAEGIDVGAGRREANEAKMAVVTPSHQYPLGAVMSLSRRLALVDWAREQNGWVLEDDYDSEYRYAGRPISALQGLDDGGRVIYVGTFSKVLFPGIRLGYMVVPPDLVEPMVQIRRSLDDQTPIAMQPVLASFIESGHFAAHIRRMRTLYAERQGCLIEEIDRQLGGLLSVAPDEAGMHLVAEINPSLGLSDQDAAKRAAEHGLTVYPLSDFYADKPDRNGLVLGYAALDERDIRAGAKRLRAALQS